MYSGKLGYFPIGEFPKRSICKQVFMLAEQYSFLCVEIFYSIRTQNKVKMTIQEDNTGEGRVYTFFHYFNS